MRLLWLTYEARVNPELSCDTVLEKSEWQSLCATINQNPIPPDTPPSLRQAIRMIARLGGFLGRKGDGEPGVKTDLAWATAITRYRCYLETSPLGFSITIFVVNDRLQSSRH